MGRARKEKSTQAARQPVVEKEEIQRAVLLLRAQLSSARIDYGSHYSPFPGRLIGEIEYCSLLQGMQQSKEVSAAS